uniref:Reverse transcriptase domain-containing protein n=1 Tax=Scylla olivacea TaxID=85551 RepID=A0A0P4VXS2_SCYOL
MFLYNFMKMEDSRNLTCVSYNCEYADDLRAPFLSELYNQSDFFLIQEHGLFMSQLDWFYGVGEGVNVHGVSAMEEGRLVRGRPHGGAAILWRDSKRFRVTPVPYESKRLCAVRVHLPEQTGLVICVYMPCDDQRSDQNVNEYVNILSDIAVLSLSNDIDFILVGGDFNTDFSRVTPQTRAFVKFIDEYRFYCCDNDALSTVAYTYCSKGNNFKSLIDHFLISDNISNFLQTYTTIDSVNNPSDHIAIKCVLDVTISYNVENIEHETFERICWHKANTEDILRYKELVTGYLLNVPLPEDMLMCRNNMCTQHEMEIAAFYDHITNALIKASKECIPRTNCGRVKKIVPGWNDCVEGYFRTALFWHRLWVDSERPQQGLIAEIRRTTRKCYHQARKMVIKQEELITTEKLAESLQASASGRQFWRSVRNKGKQKKKTPKAVDGKHCPKDIADLFKGKFEELYNSTSYDTNEMDSLKSAINSVISCQKNSNESILLITPDEVRQALRRVRPGKGEGEGDLMSDHLIHAGDVLYGHLSVLFSAMLRHGFSPHSMMKGVMIPLPKGRWANLNTSENYRAITLSSLMSKILDNIVLMRERDKLLTNDLQFGFKEGTSSTMCTAMVRETVSYYVSKGTTVYGFTLDASKAFDRVNYCKLFDILLKRNVCPLICRLLLNMYVNQKLSVRWNDLLSSTFEVSNGVKQGGVISPILYCVYVDGLLTELRDSGVGCYMGGTYAGAFGFADDLKGLAPSVFALKKMISICVDYASRYDIVYNEKKSKLIVFHGNKRSNIIPNVEINGKTIDIMEEIVHLGNVLGRNIFKCDTSKCVTDFYRQCNSFLSRFKGGLSHVRNTLFFKYCSSFYGSQLLNVCDGSMEAVYRAWRVAVRRVWKLPWTTHCSLLPHIANVMPPEMWFAKREIAFINQILTSDNMVIRTIGRMGVYGRHSIMGSNVRYLSYKFNMNIGDINKVWTQLQCDQYDLARTGAQIRELCLMRDRCDTTILDVRETKMLIDALCTE